MSLFVTWFDEACLEKASPNPHAMTLCTASPDGVPNGRIVLCKGIDAAAARIRFFTNYTSPKARDLEANPRAALVFHWDHVQRQVRMQGTIARLTAAESDEYFNSRPVLSRLGAWASDQSRPIESHEALMEKVAAAAAKLEVPAAALLGEEDANIPRPAHWGGYGFTITRMEVWIGAEGRLHDRAAWVRSGGAWSPPTRLQP